MQENQWPRRTRSTLGWNHLSATDADTGKRWTVIWDTKRREGAGNRNTASEKLETAALDRARHILRLGFIVYEIRDPSGFMHLDEAGVKQRLWPQSKRPSISVDVTADRSE